MISLVMRSGRLLAAALVLALSLSLQLYPAPISSAGSSTASPSIAFLTRPPTSTSPFAEAYWSPTPGGAPVQLTSDGRATNWISLASNGAFVVVAKNTTMSTTVPVDADLYRVNTATKAVTDISSLPGQELDPEVSPNMTKVSFFHVAPDGTTSIKVLNLSTKAITTVSSGPVSRTGAANWSHDGSRLVYTADNATGTTISVIVAAADGTSHRTVVASSGGYGECSWSPNDAYLICTDLSTTQLVAINVATAATFKLTSDPAYKVRDGVVANDWTMYFDAIGTDRSYHIRRMWLGDLTTSQAVFDTAGDSNPSLGASGPVQPAPAGFAPAATPPPPPVKPPGYRCGTVKFFGIRGSGETIIQGEGMGKTVDSTKNYLARAIPGLRFEAIDYPAIAVDIPDPIYPPRYFESMSEGRDKLLKAVQDFVKFCPHTYAVIAGYSQGAHAAGDAFGLLTDAERKHVGALLMFGDPVFNPKQPVINRGDFNDKLSGIMISLGGYTPLVIPRPSVPNVESYCTAGDPICNFNTLNAAACGPLLQYGLCAHQLYITRGWTNKAAQWAIAHLKLLPPLR